MDYSTMAKRKTRQRKRARTRSKIKTKTKTKTKTKIVDPPFARTISKGTAASPGGPREQCCGIDYETDGIDYHYQSYENVAVFLESIIRTNPSIQKDIFLFDDTSDAFLDLDLKSGHMKPLYLSHKKFVQAIKSGLKTHSRFIPIILNLTISQGDNHANILIINKKTKQIELFEPHGARTSSSELGGIQSAYKKKKTILKKFFKGILPDYKVTNVVDAVKQTAFQMTEDPKGHSGFCVTWSILYAHYRFLNPNRPLGELVQYMHHKITARLILRYAKYIETVAKS